MALTNGSGSTVASYTYDPFGNTTQTGTSANSYQYAGRENDGAGLYFNRGRYYSPAIQRFASQDPIGFAGGVNLYSYVSNNPIKFTDPYGHDKNDPWWKTFAKTVYHSFADADGCDRLMLKTIVDDADPFPSGDVGPTDVLPFLPGAAYVLGMAHAAEYSVSNGLIKSISSSTYRSIKADAFEYADTVAEAAPWALVLYSAGDGLWAANSAAYHGTCH